MKKFKEAAGREVVQRRMAPLVPLVIIGGYFWPYLGYIAITLLAIMVILVWFRSRFYCGWICAMGGFFERVLAKWSRNKSMLPIFKAAWFKWLVFSLMMGLLLFRLVLSGGEPKQVGAVFVMMWTISTGFAIALGLIWKPRSWCSLCPMGTMQGLIAPRAYPIEVSAKCKQCGLCQRVCPIETNPGSYRALGYVPAAVCMGCENCLMNCPQAALTHGRQPVLVEPPHAINAPPQHPAGC